jgi:organic hydroperoxide reductase OsmC/OhrA
VGSCLAASLVLCLEKARVSLRDLTVRVEGSMARNDAGRLRISGLTATLRPTVGGAPTGRYDHCLEIFEDFCIVTQSVREGIDVDVQVEPTFEAKKEELGEEELVGAGG